MSARTGTAAPSPAAATTPPVVDTTAPAREPGADGGRGSRRRAERHHVPLHRVLRDRVLRRPTGLAGPAGAARSAGRGKWRRGWLVAGAAAVLAALMALNPWLPNGPFNLASLWQTVLPWSGLGVVLLLLLAALRRSALAAVAVLLPALVWSVLFAPVLLDKRAVGGDFTVVSHNVNEDNPDPGRTARALAGSGADVVAVEELARGAQETFRRELASAYAFAEVHGGVALWSKYPLKDVEPVEIMPWTRAVRATVVTPKGPVALYTAHLASVRVLPEAGFTTFARNEAAGRLAAAVEREPLSRVVVVGDFNGSFDDAALRPLTGPLRSAQREAGDGFGFTWPASLPVVRIDQILVKGITARSAWTLPDTGSDHLPVAASLKL
ncbi:endonuclease/exonuclease/phosphatase family protein [Kitasatospora sp. NPDC094019]|uniref:endonuclease/exonuclease/phosphatase family protein n=1 Tax=Kitasatospora sp. NPDC094019 TaxID=3364091 RepID=UPI00381B4192